MEPATWHFPALSSFLQNPGHFSGRLELAVICGDGGFIHREEEAAQTERQNAVLKELARSSEVEFEGRWRVVNFN